MGEHGEIEKDEGGDHLADGVLIECQLEQVCRGHHEAQQERILADLRGQFHEYRKQAHQHQSDPAHRGAQKAGQPAEKYPAENRPGDHRRQAETQLRSA